MHNSLLNIRTYTRQKRTYHGVLDVEVDALLVWVDADLDRIVDGPGTVL